MPQNTTEPQPPTDCPWNLKRGIHRRGRSLQQSPDTSCAASEKCELGPMAASLVEPLHTHFDLDFHEAKALLAVYDSDGPASLYQPSLYQLQENPALGRDPRIFLGLSLNNGWDRDRDDGRYEMTTSEEEAVEEAERRS